MIDDEIEFTEEELVAGAVLLPEQLIQPKYRTEYHDFIGYIVLDAVETLIGRKVAQDDDWDADYNWLMGLDQGPWSYSWCCKVLGINQIALRKIVQRKLRRATTKAEGVSLRPSFKSARKGGRPKKYTTPTEIHWQKVEARKKNTLYQRRKRALHQSEPKK